MMPAIYGNSYDITQGPGVVAIRYEMIHETRVIPLGDAPHAGAAIRSYMGDARGRFEAPRWSWRPPTCTNGSPTAAPAHD